MQLQDQREGQGMNGKGRDTIWLNGKDREEGYLRDRRVGKGQYIKRIQWESLPTQWSRQAVSLGDRWVIGGWQLRKESGGEYIVEEIGEIPEFLESLLDILGVDGAADVAVPHGLVLVIELDEVEFLQLEDCPLQDVLGVDEGAAHALGDHQLLLELQVDLVDRFEAVGRALVHSHVVDDGHHDVLGEGAGWLGRGVLLSRFFGMKGKMLSKAASSLRAISIRSSLSVKSRISRAEAKLAKTIFMALRLQTRSFCANSWLLRNTSTTFLLSFSARSTFSNTVPLTDFRRPRSSSHRHSTRLPSSSTKLSTDGRRTVICLAARRLRTRFSKCSTKQMTRVVKTSPTYFLMSVAIHSSRLQSRICLRYSTSRSALRMSSTTGRPFSRMAPFNSLNLMFSLATARRSSPATPIRSPTSRASFWMNCISVRYSSQSTVTMAVRSRSFRSAQQTREVLPDWAGPFMMQVSPMRRQSILALASPMLTIHSLFLKISLKLSMRRTRQVSSSSRLERVRRSAGPCWEEWGGCPGCSSLLSASFLRCMLPLHPIIKTTHSLFYMPPLRQPPAPNHPPHYIFHFHSQKMQPRTARPRHPPQAIQQRLNDDFDVHESLTRAQPPTHNLQEYAQLLNTIVLAQRQRTQRKAELYASRTASATASRTVSPGASPLSSPPCSLTQLEQATSRQAEIGVTLHRQIRETKKSLNLLKGDISHLIGRNESAQLLSSKIGKVKIVAEDQLKRVTLALSKDKEEIKLRNEMQRVFSKKLRGANVYEQGSLTRLRTQHVQNVEKQQDIFSRLANTQKTAVNAEAIEHLRSCKWQTDVRNKQALQELCDLAAITRQFSAATHADAHSLLEDVHAFAVELPEAAEDELELRPNLTEELAAQILEEYARVKETIKAHTRSYQELLATREEIAVKMEELGQEQRQLTDKFEQDALEAYRIGEETRRLYREQLKRYVSNLKAHFALLTYLNKHIPPASPTPKSRPTSQLIEDSSRSTQGSTPNYVSELHCLLQTLSADEAHPLPERSHTQVDCFFSQLHAHIQHLLQLVRSKMSHQYLSDLLSKRRTKMQRRSMLYSCRNSLSHLDAPSLVQEPLRESEDEQEQMHLEHCSPTEEEGYCKLPSRTGREGRAEGKAKRIQLLEEIDADYYQLIKSTIRLEKDNTRRNYQFSQTFKRAKYSSNDCLQEEKRFEAAFSLFARPSPTPQTQSRPKPQPQTASKRSTQNHSRQQARQSKMRLAEKLKQALQYAEVVC